MARVTRTITTRGRGPLGIALLVLMLVPAGVSALTQPRIRDLADPVPPGGLLPYRITLVDQTLPTPALPSCFNPPAECVTFPVTCKNPPPSCEGNAVDGYFCENSANSGASCGVGTPPVADPSLCLPPTIPLGVCNGGPNIGMVCNAPDGALTPECPGFTFLCKRAFNEDAYCGSSAPVAPSCVGTEETGFFCQNAQNEGASCANEEGTDANPDLCIPLSTPQPRPRNDFCLQNPTGICSGGTNFGLACDTPHGIESPIQCPASTAPVVPSNITVQMPLPPGTTFFDADNGGTFDGSLVTWTVAPLQFCGGGGEPPCPQLNVRLLIDPLVPLGTVFQNTATATDQDGFLVSAPHLTLVERFRVQGLMLSYPPTDGRDRVVYRALFTLLASETIDPGNEEFRFNISTVDGTLVEFVVPAGQLPESNVGVWTFSSREPGLKSVRLRELGPGHYALRVRGARMTLPDVTNLDVTVTINIGDDTFTHPARLLVKRGGRRYVGRRSTTTTTIVSPGTTTTSFFPLSTSTTSTSITTSSTIPLSTTSSTVPTTSSTLEPSTTTSSTLDPGSTTSTTADPGTTTSTTLEPTTTSTAPEPTTTSTTLEPTTTSTEPPPTTTSTTLEPTTTTLEPTTTSTSSTSSTTLLPCGGVAPSCLGSCPPGEECTGNLLEPCTCQPIP